MKLLKDSVLVKHRDIEQDSIIYKPDTTSRYCKVVKADVLAVGSKYEHDLIIGDIVLVPFNLGNRYEGSKFRFNNEREVVLYDGEDVLVKFV